MTGQKKLIFLYCEENLHAGAGSATGTIDLPIQRESHTEFPKIESSTFRGAIRESVHDLVENDKLEKTKFERIFGNWDNGNQQSAIDFPDAKLLLFPVRSYKGVFAWITCPFVLNRFKKDVKNWFNVDLGYTISDFENNEIITQPISKILAGTEVVLEEFLFKRKTITKTDPNRFEVTPTIDKSELGEWIAGKFIGSHEIIWSIKEKLAIVSDEVFRDFVKLYTVKMTRNRINPDTGTAEGGALFNEEFLPSESVLYSFVLASNEFFDKKNRINETALTDAEVMQFYIDKHQTLIRIGGDKGIGKGLVRQNLIDL